jgi:hypothetical protein
VRLCCPAWVVVASGPCSWHAPQVVAASHGRTRGIGGVWRECPLDIGETGPAVERIHRLLWQGVRGLLRRTLSLPNGDIPTVAGQASRLCWGRRMIAEPLPPQNPFWLPIGCLRPGGLEKWRGTPVHGHAQPCAPLRSPAKPLALQGENTPRTTLTPRHNGPRGPPIKRFDVSKIQSPSLGSSRPNWQRRWRPRPA